MITQGDKTVLINSREFKERVSEIKMENPEITIKDLANKLSEEYDANITPSNVNNLIKK